MKKKADNKAQGVAIVAALVLLVVCLAVLDYMGIIEAGLWGILAPLWIPGGLVLAAIVVALVQMTREIAGEMVRKKRGGRPR